MPETAQEVVNTQVERRLTVLENVSAQTLLTVEKQAVIVGLMAKAFMGGAGAIGLTVLYGVLRLVFKAPFPHG